MADVLHHPQRHDRGIVEAEPEAPERVPESDEVRGHRERLAERAHGAGGGRGRGWWAVVALVVAGVAGILVASARGADTDVVEWPAQVEGPGSNSLAPVEATVHVDDDLLRLQVEVHDEMLDLMDHDVFVQWPTAADGPGSNSLGTD